MKPDDIPQDVWLAAMQTASMLPIGSHDERESAEIVARAIMAERERCAMKAESRYTPRTVMRNSKGELFHSGKVAMFIGAQIAAAIRKGE